LSNKYDVENSFTGPDSMDECSYCGGTGQINRSVFGKKLRNDRNTLGISQKKLAEECGISVATVSLIENGVHSPRKPTLVMIKLAMDKFEEDIKGG
jgi:DNA-binding XRE family transcriptional regulator